MAVVQISRIQIRRGKEQDATGLPQLASGEMAWAVDTQKLYIGNGSVAEGSPAVGNTRVLTEHDVNGYGDFLSLLSHTYKPTLLQTGPTANAPVVRFLQDRLDDRVTLKDFGAVGDGVVDDTAAIQRAINELFLKSSNPSYGTSASSVASRIILEIPPGYYRVTATLHIPSYANIVGSGAGRTIFQYTGTGPAIQAVHDGYPSAWDNSTGTQPKSITMKGISVWSNSTDSSVVLLNSVVDSRFENFYISGGYSETYTVLGGYSGNYNLNNQGITLTSYSAVSTSARNIFKDVKISNCSYGIFSKHDIIDNVFEDFSVYNVRIGIGFGIGSNNSIGQQFGPRNTTISRGVFGNVKQQALYINLGTNNIIRNTKLGTAGANGGNVTFTKYSQIHFKTIGNTALDIQSDRPEQLSNNTNITTPYVPEQSGKGKYISYSSQSVTLTQMSSPSLAFRLPVSTDDAGVPSGSIVYTIDYSYQSSNNAFTRRGTMTISALVSTGAPVSYTNTRYQMADDYDFAGVDTNDKSLKLTFSVKFLDQTGVDFTGAGGQRPSSIAVRYTNTLVGDTGILTYTYTAIQ
jgi:hypothetical protein